MGGDRRTGWGSLAISGRPVPCADHLYGEWKLESAGEDADGLPVIRPVGEGCVLPARLICDDRVDGLMEGELEVVVGRDWGETGVGRKLSKRKVCWAPGSRFKKEPGAGMAFWIDCQGFWKLPDRL